MDKHPLGYTIGVIGTPKSARIGRKMGATDDGKFYYQSGADPLARHHGPFVTAEQAEAAAREKLKIKV
jgi:hypothetical protein